MLTLSALVENAPERQPIGPLATGDSPNPTAARLVEQIGTAHDALTAVLAALQFFEEWVDRWSLVSNTNLQAARRRAEAIVAAPPPAPSQDAGLLAARLTVTHQALYLLLLEAELHFARINVRTPSTLHRPMLAAYALLAEAARTRAAR